MSSALEYAWALTNATVTFEVSAKSDRGRVRSVNEDRFVAAPPFFLVADGMGGHAFGDRASEETTRIIAERLPSNGPSTAEQVLDAITAADAAVHDIGAEEFAGTTLVGVAIVASAQGELHWLVCNIGDSRIYAWDGATLDQLSTDHSAVQELVEQGVITPAEAAVHPARNVVTRAIGSGSVAPDISLLPAGGSQAFVICSDGLTKELSDARIAEILAETGPRSHADRLVEAALEAGGADNVTVVVVECVIRPVAPSDGTLPAHLEETLPRG
jgi:serine/threonine protein phosphatase PrpC